MVIKLEKLSKFKVTSLLVNIFYCVVNGELTQIGVMFHKQIHSMVLGALCFAKHPPNTILCSWNEMNYNWIQSSVVREKEGVILCNFVKIKFGHLFFDDISIFISVKSRRPVTHVPLIYDQDSCTRV